MIFILCDMSDIFVYFLLPSSSSSSYPTNFNTLKVLSVGCARMLKIVIRNEIKGEDKYSEVKNKRILRSLERVVGQLSLE